MSNRLAPFNPTHEIAIDIAIDLLRLRSDDILFDLGCGDGRMLLRAASKVPGLRCVGIEIDESLARRGRDMAIAKSASTSLGLPHRVEIRNSDVLEEMDVLSRAADTNIGTTDNKATPDKQRLTLLNDATAVFVYLLPQGLKRIRISLEEAAKRRKALDNSTKLRVASYIFSIPEWTPVHVDRSAKGGCPIYLYEL